MDKVAWVELKWFRLLWFCLILLRKFQFQTSEFRFRHQTVLFCFQTVSDQNQEKNNSFVKLVIIFSAVVQNQKKNEILRQFTTKYEEKKSWKCSTQCFQFKTKKEQVQEKKRPANVLLTSVSGFRSKSEKRQKYLSIYLEIFKGKVVKMSNDLLSILQNITGKKNIILFKIWKTVHVTLIFGTLEYYFQLGLLYKVI